MQIQVTCILKNNETILEKYECEMGTNCFMKETLYSSHLIIVAKKTWPIGGRIIGVPLYYQYEKSLKRTYLLQTWKSHKVAAINQFIDHYGDYTVFHTW